MIEANKTYQGHALEVLKTFPDDSIDCCITSPPYWCYSADTEILTKNGWKFIGEVKENDIVYSVNPANMEIGLTTIKAKKVWDYEGSMVHFFNTHIDLLVTPNHNMFVVNKHFKPVWLRHLYEKRTNKKTYFIKAIDIKQGHITPKTGFKWTGNNTKYFILPKLKTNYNRQLIFCQEKKIDIRLWLSFFGLWIAEGSVRGSKGGKKKVYEINIKQKYPKSKKVRKLLLKLPFKFKEYKYGDMSNFSIIDCQLWYYLKQFGNSHTKFVPVDIKLLTPDLLRIFLRWYLFGDGTIKYKGTSHREVSCYSVSSVLKNDLAEISLKIGSNISIREGNQVVFLRRKSVKLFETKKIVNYKGKIVGIELNKNHTLIVRRNNKIIVSGNSLRDYNLPPQIWDGVQNCEHQWVSKERKLHSGTTKSKISGDNSGHLNEVSTTDNFCSLCGAWRGSLGLEPSFTLFISHLIQIFTEVKRVLKPTGTCWINLGDSYAGSNGNGYKQTLESEKTFWQLYPSLT